MEEQSKKLNNLRESRDAVFKEIFGFNKPKEESFGYNDNIISIGSDHVVVFNRTGSSVVNPLPNYGAWTKLDWSSNNFSWMAKSAFKADAAQIEGKGNKRKVVSFQNCLFESGDFRGGKFIGSKGKFAGDSFVGQFGPGAEWLTTPFAFVDGTTKENETILGQKNITAFNQNKFEFNVIRVTPKSKIIIKMQDGVSHEITVIKRLDGDNSKFQFKIKNGENNKVFKLIVSWAYLRGNSKEEFENNTVFSNSQIPGLFIEKFKLGFNSPITKVMVTEDISYEEDIIEPGKEKDKTSEELASSQETFDLINIPFFGIKDIKGQPITIKSKRGQYKNNVGRVHFNFTNNDQLNGFKNTVKNLESQVLRADLTSLKSALKNKVIDGAPINLPYLSNLIGPISKEKSKIELDKNLFGSMSRIESLLKDFVDTMVFRVKRSDGVHDVSNEKVKELSKDGIKRFLGISSEETVEPIKSKPKSGLKKKGPATLQEAVREIISKNLKHF